LEWQSQILGGKIQWHAHVRFRYYNTRSALIHQKRQRGTKLHRYLLFQMPTQPQISPPPLAFISLPHWSVDSFLFIFNDPLWCFDTGSWTCFGSKFASCLHMASHTDKGGATAEKVSWPSDICSNQKLCVLVRRSIHRSFELYGATLLAKIDPPNPQPFQLKQKSSVCKTPLLDCSTVNSHWAHFGYCPLVLKQRGIHACLERDTCHIVKQRTVFLF
jgi:hypothetical protein